MSKTPSSVKCNGLSHTAGFLRFGLKRRCELYACHTCPVIGCNDRGTCTVHFFFLLFFLFEGRGRRWGLYLDHVYPFNETSSERICSFKKPEQQKLIARVLFSQHRFLTQNLKRESSGLYQGALKKKKKQQQQKNRTVSEQVVNKREC